MFKYFTSKYLFLSFTLLVSASVTEAMLTTSSGFTSTGGTPPELHTAAGEAIEYGVDVWSSPGLKAMTQLVFMNHFSGILPAAPTPATTNNPLFGTINNYSLVTSANVGFTPMTLGLYQLSPSPGNSLSALMSPAAATITGGVENVPSANVIQLGVFPNLNQGETIKWVYDYLAGPTGAGLLLNLKTKFNYAYNPISRGQQLMSALAYELTPQSPALTVAQQDFLTRQVLVRHKQQVASYRSMGINPMWPYQVPGATAPIGYGAPDFYLNVTSKFFYKEGNRHHDATTANLDALGFLYKIWAGAQAYETGTINSRYVPTDPSCRIDPASPTNACDTETSSEKAYFSNWADFKANRYKISFGSASDLVLLYDIIKYFTPAGGSAEATAMSISTGGYGTLTAAAGAKLGAAYPTTIDTIAAAALALYNQAYAIWNAPTFVPTNKSRYAPRVSAALMVAAALAGKKIDPALWGVIGEAEYGLMQNNLSAYNAWATTLLANADFKEELKLSLSNFASFRPTIALPAAIPPATTAPNAADYYEQKALLPYDLSSVQKFFANFLKSEPSKRLPLARGPFGLMSVNGERFETPTMYRPGTTSTNILGFPFPNAYAEAATTGRSVLDGNLLFTSDGKVYPQDLDYNEAVQAATFNTLPFEADVIKGSRGKAASVYGVSSSAPLTMPSLTSKQNLFLAQQNFYRTYYANTKALLIKQGSIHSKLFQQALNFWYVIENKLSTSGFFSTLSSNRPQFASITFGTPVIRPRFYLFNLSAVTLSDSAGNPYTYTNPGPLSNAIPFENYSFAYGPTTPSAFPPYYINMSIRTILNPFISWTNYLLNPIPKTFDAWSASVAPAPPAAPVMATFTVASPSPATGPTSAPCVAQAAYKNSDPLVNCTK